MIIPFGFFKQQIALLLAEYPLADDANEIIGTTPGIDGVPTNVVFNGTDATFNGSSSKIVIPDNDIFSVADGSGGDKPFSIEFDITVNNQNTQWIFDKRLNPVDFGDWDIFYNVNGFNLRIISADGTAYIARGGGGTNIANGVSNHVKLTYDGSKTQEGIKIELNSVSAPITANSSGIYVSANDTTNPVTVGLLSFNTSNYFNGTLKNVKINNYNPIISNFVADGNSLTFGQGSTGSDNDYPSVLQALLDTFVYNNGLARTTATMITDAITQVDPRIIVGNNILTGWEGRNDMSFLGNPTTAYNNLVTYYTARQSAGWKVVAATVLPSYNPGYKGGTTVASYNEWEADRQTLNTLLRDNWTDWADAFVDFADNADLDTFHNNEQAGYVWSAATAPITSANGLFDDGTHLTNAGYVLVAGLFYDAIQTL